MHLDDIIGVNVQVSRQIVDTVKYMYTQEPQNNNLHKKVIYIQQFHQSFQENSFDYMSNLVLNTNNLHSLSRMDRS